MELGEIIRIQDNVQTYLRPSFVDGSGFVFSEILTETLPRNKLIDLEFEVLAKGLELAAKAKKIREDRVQEVLERGGDVTTHSLHRHLMLGIDIMTSLRLEEILNMKGKRWGTVLKESENKERTKKIQSNLDLFDISISSKRLEKDLQRTLGRLYEILNEVNGEYAYIVDTTPLLKLYSIFQLREEPKDETLRYIWGCIVSKKLTRNQALAFAFEKGPSIADIISGITDIPIIMFKTPDKVKELRPYVHELIDELGASWNREARAENKREKIEKDIAKLEEEKAKMERDFEVERKDIDKKYREAKERITELESGEAVQNSTALEANNADLRKEVADLKKEIKQYEGLAEECANDAAQLEEKLAEVIAENESLRSQIENPITDETPGYIIQNPTLQANIERSGFNYNMICAIVVAGFKWGRYSNTKVLSDESIRKNVRGKIGDQNMKQYEKHFKALYKAKAILRGGTGGYSLNADIDAIQIPYFRQVVREFLELKKSLQE
ncbi:hypothetical protein KY335_02490 [Candidatus Woesearchaeota archaeon]|nr:hypothetical protein [Candidatus Woesearchaeota archaeon]